jgi:predicted amidohydrolase YtcJ
MKNTFLFICIIFLFSSCFKSEKADLIIHNATIYTVDNSFSTVQAMAVKDGKIIALGAEREILNKYDAPEIIDAKTMVVYPGFIDAHCHFLNYGLIMNQVDLTGTKSPEEMIQRVVDFDKLHPENEWITGRGWDQNNWPEKKFPDKKKLDDLFPDKPVYLKRIDGHAALINTKAMQLARIEKGSSVIGGKFILNNGILEQTLINPENFSGILIDNTMNFVDSVIPEPSEKEKIKALLQAQQNCFSVGLTTVDDAGLEADEVALIKKLQEDTLLKMRVYAMLSPTSENIKTAKTGKIKTERLNVSSFKLYADGALGSRGAFLKDPYSDDTANYGMLFDTIQLHQFAKICAETGYQMNAHCIGDAANLYVLNLYSKILGGTNDKRWRIEHAQVVDTKDMQLFSLYNIIPSVQPTHATSDMYWAEERLGKERIKNAYAYKSLSQQNGLIALGTDFPVEDISPVKTFYAAVFRKDAKGFPQGGFNPENALSREDALRGMTIFAAIANFEENEKGSLEVGKLADFVILNRDILKCSEEQILQTKVLYTFVNGEKVFDVGIKH